jgi:hypothetical protein
MRGLVVPAALAERLGEDASAAFTEMVMAHDDAQVEYVVMQCAERFERRLTEEASKLRVEMSRLGSDIRQEMSLLRTDLRTEIATGRVELLKWGFMFWIGQVISIVGFVSLLIRR